MQDKYTADVGDYGKYGLLDLCRDAPSSYGAISREAW